MRRFATMLAIVLCALCIDLLPVTGQTVSGPQTLFGTTRNPADGRMTVWRFDIPEARAIPHLRMDAVNPATPRELFPESERDALDAAVARRVYTRGDSDTPGVSQRIDGVWQMDTSSLLILQRFEVCQRPMTGCYGFYRFALLDVESEAVSTLFDYPYTNIDVETWEGCPGTQVRIDDVLPHPQRKIVAFTVEPRVPCVNAGDSLVFLFDYTRLPVGRMRIPNSGHPSWSPDGGLLAYITRRTCEETLCEMALRIWNAETGGISTVETGTLHSVDALFTAWTDNATVFYQWRDVSSGGDEPYELVWYNLTSETFQRERTMPFRDGQVHYLSDMQQTNMIGLRLDFSAVGFAAAPGLAVAAEFTEAGVFAYNSRIPGYVLFNVSMAGHRADYIDASLSRGTVNLAGMVPWGEDLGNLSVGLR